MASALVRWRAKATLATASVFERKQQRSIYPLLPRQRRLPRRRYRNQVTTSPPLAQKMATAVSHPSKFIGRDLTWLPMIFLLFVMSSIRSSRGGVEKPFLTAPASGTLRSGWSSARVCNQQLAERR